MSDKIIKLTDLSNQLSNEIKWIVDKYSIKYKIYSIIIGDENLSNKSYFNGIKKRMNSIGLEFEILNFNENYSENDIVDKIDDLNNDKNCCGIIIQMPIPENINIINLINKINFEKDIDGLSYVNRGRLFSGNPFIIPATAWAVDIFLSFFERNYNFKLEGKTVSIIGRSNIVGKPVFHLLLKRNLTVSIVHTKTFNPWEISKKSEIVIAACGVPQLIDDSWIGIDSVVIDVGIHCLNNETCKLCGDVNVSKAKERASYITAVPGGIGALTNTLLVANSIKSYFKTHKGVEYKFSFE